MIMSQQIALEPLKFEIKSSLIIEDIRISVQFYGGL